MTYTVEQKTARLRATGEVGAMAEAAAADHNKVTPVAPQWLQRLADHHRVYIHPAFHQEAA